MLVRMAWQYLPAQITAPTVQLLSLLAFAHLLPIDQLGLLTLVIAAQEVLFAGLFAWWVQFMLRHRASQLRPAFLRAERFALTGAIITQVVLVAFLARLWLPAFSATFILSIILFVCLRSLSTYMAERARSESRVLLYTLIVAVFPALGMALAILAAIRIDANAETMLIAMALAHAVAVIVAFFASDIGRAAERTERKILPQALRFGLPMGGAALMSVAALNAPRFIVEHIDGLAAAGIFAVSYGIGVRVASVAVMLVSTAAYPLAVKVDHEQGQAAGDAQLARNMALVMLVAAPFTCGLIAISGSLIDIALPAHLRESAYVLLPLATALGFFRYLRSHTCDQLFLLRSRTDIVAALSVADLILSVLLASLGLWQFGLAGAIAGPLVGALIIWLASLSIAVVRFGFVFPSFTFARIAIAAISMMLVIATLPATSSAAMLGVHVAAGAVLYAIMIAALFPKLVARWFFASKTSPA